MAALIRRLPLPHREPTTGPAPAKQTLNRPSNPDHGYPNPTYRTGKASFATLPPEIHLLISKQLIYPDALSLKHTNRYFYNLVDTGVRLKIAWLVERRQLHLECPNDRRCDLGSDLRFCRGSVRLLMQRRREHIECESRPGLGCLINGTATCPQARKLNTRLKRWLRVRLISIEIWGVLLAVIPLLVAWCLMYYSPFLSGLVSGSV
ncbi:hypothetical protein B0T16DRAFT_189240 [Cercophora newfieldiana]|uniref:F-box domain-containing protein n=1 Tax=Cercophora newfieldiana TaxID=92897 RepID=A0AA39Y0N1_9PEZI|nr:hypothetical protein B0T16DRAFT_189240 [Cercophora newfieldiana]